MSFWRFETCDIIRIIPNRYFWIPVHVGLGFVTEIKIFCKNYFLQRKVSKIKNNTSMYQRFDVSAVGDGLFLIPFFFGYGSLHFYLASNLGNVEMNFDWPYINVISFFVYLVWWQPLIQKGLSELPFILQNFISSVFLSSTVFNASVNTTCSRYCQYLQYQVQVIDKRRKPSNQIELLWKVKSDELKITTTLAFFLLTASSTEEATVLLLNTGNIQLLANFVVNQYSELWISKGLNGISRGLSFNWRISSKCLVSSNSSKFCQKMIIAEQVKLIRYNKYILL